MKAREDTVKAQLRAQGYQSEDLEIEFFSRFDDQAEALHLALKQRLEKGPFALITAGHGSAVFLHALDLNPSLLADPGILGWVNMNGKLFGDPLAPTRAPASLTKADRQIEEAKHELLLLREGRTTKQTPLGAKFPVLNLVTMAGKNRPGVSLRDSILPEGKTLYQTHGDSLESLPYALPKLPTALR